MTSSVTGERKRVGGVEGGGAARCPIQSTLFASPVAGVGLNEERAAGPRGRSNSAMDICLRARGGGTWFRRRVPGGE